MGIKEYLNGKEDGITRRDMLKALGAGAATATTAGCITNGKTTDPTTTTQTPNTTEKPTTTEQNTTTEQKPVTAEDLQQKRANLTEDEKAAHYRQALPNATGYNLDMNRVLEENNTRREQIQDIHKTVGKQYQDWVQGQHAAKHAINQLPWINWENKNITNIVTRYNSRPGGDVTINYQTTDNKRNLDSFITRADATGGKTTYTTNIPNSEHMDGDEGNYLITDVDVLEMVMDEREIPADEWESYQLSMQTVIPGVIGASVAANGHSGRDATDQNIIFNGDALNYIGNAYGDSAEAAHNVTVDALEIAVATEEVRNEGMYVELGADEEGLHTDEIYEQAKGKEVMRQPVEL